MTSLRIDDTAELRKARGAFFTPTLIAEHLTSWALNGNPHAKVLDPTCGEAVFLQAAGGQLKALGRHAATLDTQLFGVDLHHGSLDAAMELLERDSLDAHLVASDFFAIDTPDSLSSPLPLMDAVVGNPPFVRYQEHVGTSRKLSIAAALKQGVRLNGLASSWAATLVHSTGFLKQDGRLAMVLPAEILTVGYAEPVRTWLRRRFARVNLVMFERLQFESALEKVILLLAEGSGGCDSFSLYQLESADGLASLKVGGHVDVVPPAEGKWTDLLLPHDDRELYRQVVSEHFVPLKSYGVCELGTVTGANNYFTMSEATRLAHGLSEGQLARISPPGTKHLKGLSFTSRQWDALRHNGERVWLFRPDIYDDTPARLSYTDLGEKQGVHDAYKCQIRKPWWRPPLVPAPDLFFTYMSHRYPRLITNSAGVAFLNSMHGVRLNSSVDREVKTALPLLCLNSVTMLGAELHGRSYGGGILKMEPREAASLPLPSPSILRAAWMELKPLKRGLDRQLLQGHWTEVVKRVDAAVIGSAAGLRHEEVSTFLESARFLREIRIGKSQGGVRGARL